MSAVSGTGMVAYSRGNRTIPMREKVVVLVYDRYVLNYSSTVRTVDAQEVCTTDAYYYLPAHLINVQAVPSEGG
jgi:hypothetical protein